MIEIKFRAWDKKENKFVSPCINLLMHINSLMSKLKDERNIKYLQYIGVKDIYDKEIYEGDILQFVIVTPVGYEHYDGYWVDTTPDGEIGVVVVKEGSFQLKIKDNEPIPFSNLLMERFEVIGNVYENPELL